MTIADDDKALAALSMSPNSSMQEGDPWTEEEEKQYTERILPKLQDPTVVRHLDENSRIRIYRGMVTNNKGTLEECFEEAIDSFDRISKWRRDNKDILGKDLNGEALMFNAMNTHVGGEDLYGHIVWAERLGDISAVVDHPLSVEDAQAIRLKTMELIRVLQLESAENRGERRYKQVVIIDLSQISLGSIITRAAVREMTTAIMSSANSYCPETMWKCFIINAPFIFRSVYTIISPFIHPVTKEKIKILGGQSKYLPEMMANGVPLEAIPEIFGGKCPNVPLPEALKRYTSTH